MSSISINGIIELQTQKLDIIKCATTLLKCKNNIKDDLQNLSCDVTNMELDINNINELMKQTEDTILSLQNMFPLLQSIEDSYHKVNNSSQITGCINAINNAIKSDEIKSKPQEVTSEIEDFHCKENLDSKKNTSTAKKISNKLVAIDLLNQDEFNSIPKYIIGRNNVAIVNNFICTLNEILQNKYSFLALGRMKAKKKNQLEKYMKYKTQETSIKVAKGNEVHFFTEEDYQIYTHGKLDKIKLNFLTALRHVRRIEFIKINRDVYYAIVDNQNI